MKQSGFTKFMKTECGFAPILIVLLVTAVLGIGGYFAFRDYSTNQTKITPTQQSSPRPFDETANWKLDQDIPPLYPNVKWEATKSGEIVLFDGQNTIKLTAKKVESVVLKDIPKEWTGYYYKHLQARGWHSDSGAAAGGGGAFGGQEGYQKNGHYFILQSSFVGSQENPTGYKLTIMYN